MTKPFIIRDGARVVLRADPIGGDPVVLPFPAGVTIAEVVRVVPLPNDGMRPYLDACIDGVPIGRDRWHVPLEHGMIVSIQLRLGGGGNRGTARKILTAVAAIALIGSTAVGIFGVPGVAALAAGTIGAKLLAGGLALAGVAASMAAQGLALPVKAGNDATRTDRLGFASAANSFEPNGYMQRPLGRRRVFPKAIQPPFTERVGKDQYVTSAFGLAGEVVVYGTQIDDADADGMNDIEVEVGDSESPLALLGDYTRIEDASAIQISAFKTDPDDTDLGFAQLDDSLSTAEASPAFHRMETKNDVDGFRFEFLFPQGLSATDEPGAVALRIRGRRRVSGSWGSWFNLPELIIRAKEISAPVFCELDVQWVDAYPGTAGNAWPPTAKSFSRIKGWAQNYTNIHWPSDLRTVSGSGFTQWEYENQNRIILYLLTSQYPQGRYQFEVMRSWPIYWPNYNTTTNVVTSGVGDQTDFFSAVFNGSVFGVPFNPATFQHEVVSSSRQNRWAEYPITADGEPDTIIVVRAKNRQVGRVSVDAAALVENWRSDGAVSLLLHADGADGSTTFTDSSAAAHTISLHGDPEVDTAQSMFGGASCSLDGNDGLDLDGSSAFAFGDGDFTIEGFIRPTIVTFTRTIFDGRPSGFASGNYPALHILGGVLQFMAGNTVIVASASSIPIDTWTHGAVARVAGVTRLFVNGIREDSAEDETAYIIGASRPRLGARYDDGSGLIGHLDEFRVTKGVGRYITDFAVPSEAYPDPTEGEWVGFEATDNPAALHRHILTARHNANPVPSSRLRLQQIQDWHVWADATQRRCSAVIEGRSIIEALSLVDVAGWAVPSFGSKYGAVVDRLRPEGPLNIISHRNAFGFRFRKDFGDRPHALRVQWPDEDSNGEVREIVVYDEDYSATGTLPATKFETILYDSIPTEALARARAEHDLAVSKYRQREVYCSQDLEYLENSQGDLVMLETDIIGKQGGRARVDGIVLDSVGMVAGVTLDEKRSFAYADETLASRGVAIRLHDGTIMVAEATMDDSDEYAIAFAEPFELPTDTVIGDLLRAGSLLVTGPLGREARPMIVRNIRPTRGRRAELTLVDYASLEVYGSEFNSGFSSSFDASFDASFA